MKMSHTGYRFLFWFLRIVEFFWHPVFIVRGLENVPEGPCVMCSNHSGYADPLWIIFALNPPRLFRIVAKDSLLHIPLLGRLFDRLGLIGIRRGEQDVGAIKTSLQTLKEGGKLLIFPEGTRVKERIPAKTGALMLAERGGCPVLPIYTSRRRYPFQPVRVTLGAPYAVQSAGRRATPAELREQTDALMDKIYAMGEMRHES